MVTDVFNSSYDREGKASPWISIPRHLVPSFQSYFGAYDGQAFSKMMSVMSRTGMPLVEVATKEREGRLINLAILCDRLKGQKGSFVECGVGNGCCLALMKHFSQNECHVWGFDSFEGLPELTEEDEGSGQRFVGERLGRQERVHELFKTHELSFDDEKTHIIKGFVEETLSQNDVGQISILRIDVDWYKGTSECLNRLYNNVKSGGVIIVDDYACWKGCRKAVNEFREKHNIVSPLIETRGDWSEVYWFKN